MDVANDPTESLGPEIPEDLLWTEHPPGTVLADRYTVVRRVGSGGYATVYLADDTLLRRQVALKVLHPSRVAGHGLARLRREVLVAREVRSPHLVEIYDLVISEGVAFLTLEWVEGETLQERMRREGPLDVDEAVDIAHGILAGLEALHTRGILHRDVKPSNVLLSAEGVVRLLDFGLALRWAGGDTRITATEAVVGTAEYLSPEQILGDAVGPATDLYSFGATLYEMLTGEPAYGRGSSFQTILARLEKGPRRPSDLREEIPAWLEMVILRLLERRPSDRYPSTLDVERELETRTSSWVTPKRKRRGAWIAVAILLGLAATLGIWTWVRREPPSFSHMARLAAQPGLTAVGADGSMLWSLPDHRGSVVPALLRPGEPRRLVALLAPRGSRRDAEDLHRLRTLDPLTGRTLRTIDLPDAGPNYFPDFSNEFGAQLRVLDLDGDGFDEILAYYAHMYWPSYTVLYEPRIERTRVLFFAGGHQRPAVPLDATGDGRAEMIFFGYANRLGYTMGTGAVEIDPWINEDPGRHAGRVAHTPDPHLARYRNENLVWFEILPHDACLEIEEDCVQTEGDSVQIHRARSSDIRLDRNGFRIGLDSGLSAEARQTSRFRVYDLAAEARLLSETATPAIAIEAARRASTLARRVVDPGLEEYADRVLATLLVRSGRHEEAEARFRDLYELSEIPSNIAYDAAETFHLEGELDRAIRWYESVFHTNPAGYSGRPRHEALAGLVLAWLERGDAERARDEASRISDAIELADFKQSESLEAFLSWLTGDDYDRPPLSARQIDFFRYLNLELQLAEALPPSELLSLVRQDLDRTSVTHGLLLSLEAEILRRQGDPARALPLAEEALEITLDQRDEIVHYRTFTPVVAERLAVVLGDFGREEEARTVRRDHVSPESPLPRTMVSPVPSR